MLSAKQPFAVRGSRPHPRCPVEDNSVRGTARIVGVDKKTVLRLLADVGDACDACLDQAMRGIESSRLQLDEIRSFRHAKERNLPREKRGTEGIGDLWTWTAIDADTKLIVTWRLGKRTTADADTFVRDLAERVLSERRANLNRRTLVLQPADPKVFLPSRRPRLGDEGLRPHRRRCAEAEVHAPGREARSSEGRLGRAPSGEYLDLLH
jgi:hypothetical protein